jgi:hypothetical protein
MTLIISGLARLVKISKHPARIAGGPKIPGAVSKALYWIFTAHPLDGSAGRSADFVFVR